MNYRQGWIIAGTLLSGFLALRCSISADEGKEDTNAEAAQIATLPRQAAAKAVSVDTARDRARTLHKVYSSTLDVLHDHYFHANRAVLPARAMEDIFSLAEAESDVKVRWIAVNAKAMSVDHEPSDDFEKEAARRIATGDKAIEQIGTQTYRFAGSIPLQESCVQCHMGTFTAQSVKPRFAGLVISIPIKAEP